LELAELDGIINAVVLHVIIAAGCPKCSRSGHSVSVHVGEPALARNVVEISRSVRFKKKKKEKLFVISGA